MRKLTLLIGIPASGKSMYRRQHANNMFVFSYDDIQKSLFGPKGKHRDIGEKYGFVHKEAALNERNIFEKELRRHQGKLFDSTKDVLIDSVNASAYDRRKIIKYYQSAFSDVECIYMTTSFDECIRRNNKRDITDRVPSEIMQKFIREYKKPTYKEPFNKIYAYVDNLLVLIPKKEINFFVSNNVGKANLERIVSEVGTILPSKPTKISKETCLITRSTKEVETWIANGGAAILFDNIKNFTKKLNTIIEHDFF